MNYSYELIYKDSFPMTFFDLIRSGNLEEIKNQVNTDPSLLSKKDDKGFPPLIMACYVDQYKITEFLLSKDVDINDRDGAGNTALMGVSFKGNVEIAKLLIDHGADINIQNYQGYTALIYAATFDQKEVAEILISHSADASVKDENGKTAMDHAEFKGLTNIVDLLNA